MAGCYQDYSPTAQQTRRMRDADELYRDAKQKPRGAEIKCENDFACSNFDSDGSYKCTKCYKVRFPTEFHFNKVSCIVGDQDTVVTFPS